ncbi:tRNA pseudouridine(38-40) synthase TruA [Pedobacter sp.]|uniref:tRNA pseudouridine(38-40) synthase TruA n=1 Tax=Pedobacter sp. TaxID=1411316 RepID=UPI00396CF8FE
MLLKRFFIEISYDGTDFHGWQIQPNAITVQFCLDKALSTFFRQEVNTVGCGRTDTGVHATQFFAHFDLKEISEFKSQAAITGINALLPFSIAVRNIFEVDLDANSRFDAVSRTYKYYIHFNKDPFKVNRSWLYKWPLDLHMMNEAAAALMDYTDFSCFSKSKTQTFTNNCKLMHAKFEETDGGLVFTVKADRFLRNMVRAIVGTLIMVGKGDIGVDEVKKIVESKSRSNAGQSVPACGLYLFHIAYPSTEKVEI